MGRRLAGLFHGRPRLQVGALLAGPVGWLVVGYLGSLAVLLITAFWTVDPLSGEVVQGLQPRKLRNAGQRTGLPRHRLADRRAPPRWSPSPTPIIAFPIAFYMAKVASRRGKAILVVAVLLPLWSSYLVKVLSWRTMLSNDGVINWALEPVRPARPRLRHHRGLAGDELPLAAVHDPADLRRAGAHPRTR